MTSQIHALAIQLGTLPFADRVSIAHTLGLAVACCPGCGCYVGSPDCDDTRPDDCVCSDNPDNRPED